MTGSIVVYCDFDGTVAPVDTVDLLLEHLADPSWREIEERWEKGEISARECMARQVPLLRGGWAAMQRILDPVELAPAFAEMVEWCRRHGVRVEIVSEGIDRVIRHLLDRENIRVDAIWANHLLESTKGDLSLTFPHFARRWECSAGLCKCHVVDRRQGPSTRVFVGDGRSDFCCATRVDWLFARSRLLTHCREKGLRCIPFEGFGRMIPVLRRILAQPQIVPARWPTAQAVETSPKIS